MDSEGFRRIWDRIQDIDVFLEAGPNDRLENEKVKLTRQIEELRGERMKASVSKAYNNISTQKRNFIRDKLTPHMPKLAAHLKSYIKQTASEYTFSYQPPEDTPRWQTENSSENPSA